MSKQNKIALYNAADRKFREIDPAEKDLKEFYTPFLTGRRPPWQQVPG
jgi:hypothetical protein